ncbi:hypothetical protein BH20ACI1_BH20ACI1_01330 [soil metagenome]
MSETVFMFGAGINRILINDGLQPPLATDFFQQIFKQKRSTRAEEFFIEERYLLFGYIERYWKLSIEQLKDKPFDLEECYTLIQLQKIDAEKKGNKDLFNELWQIESQLTILFAEYLANFHLPYNLDFHKPDVSKPFHLLGEVIYKEKATVITFNYDTLLEGVIQNASDANQNSPKNLTDVLFRRIEVTDETIAYSHHNWNIPLAYGIEFDEVQLYIAGGPLYVSGERFYSHPQNQIYGNPFLKLHGSVNWFTFSGNKIPGWSGGWTEQLGVEADFPHAIENARDRTGKTVLVKGSWYGNDLPQHKGEFLNPVIITPVLYKDYYQYPFIKMLWDRAYLELSNCKRLIVGGYSFPPTDFHTKRLFLETFADRSPEEIIVINPVEEVIKTVKELCNFKKPVKHCRDLVEFCKLDEFSYLHEDKIRGF